jgi:hypothetical protein
VTRVIVGDLRTGRRWSDVPFLDVSWSSRLGTYDTVTVKVTLADPDVVELDLRSSAAVGKSFIGVVEFDVFVAAGPVWDQSWDADSNVLTMSASGWETYFSHRVILPPRAADQSAYPIILPTGTTPIVVGPDDTREAGDSNPAVDTTITGYDWGSIASLLAQQALSWPGSPGIFVFPALVAGSRTRTYKASELKNVYDAMKELSSVENGPEIRWETRWTADRKDIEVLFRAGTNSNPRLTSPQTHRWDLSVEESPLSKLKVDVSGSNLAGQAWLNGGRSVNKALIRRGYNPTLVSEGYALFETVDSHPTASLQTTLDEYAAEIVRVGSKPTELWSFVVQDVDLAVGDYGDLVAKKGAYIPAGVHPRRAVGLSGNSDTGEYQVTVTTAEVSSG